MIYTGCAESCDGSVIVVQMHEREMKEARLMLAKNVAISSQDHLTGYLSFLSIRLLFLCRWTYIIEYVYQIFGRKKTGHGKGRGRVELYFRKYSNARKRITEDIEIRK